MLCDLELFTLISAHSSLIKLNVLHGDTGAFYSYKKEKHIIADLQDTPSDVEKKLIQTTHLKFNAPAFLSVHKY